VTQERLIALVAAFFGGLALRLAAVGLYGVVAHAVRARQKEIGLRIALGATPSSILRIVFESVGLLIAAGLALGAAGSLWAARFVEALLFQLAPRDPATFGGAAIVLVAVGVMAAWLPAYRAARLDPVAASEPSEPATSSAGTESRSRRGLAQVSRPSGRVRIATD
jgi:putative ABC transport system permease protein